MASGKRPLLYWDTSVLLAWIKNENRPNREMDGVNDVAQGIIKGHFTLLTSVMTHTEVLESTLSPDAQAKFMALFKRRNCQMVATDHRIAALSSEIRNYYQMQKLKDGLPSLSSPDAIHLATAIHYTVKEFHTFDERDQPNKRRGLIPLTICKPPIPPMVQGELYASGTNAPAS
jgi:predicted nucleic acid-binding protein